MQKTKLFSLSVLAVLLVCSALSVTAAQDATPTETTNPETNVSSTTAPDVPQDTPVEGNQTEPSRAATDLAPIHEANGEPAYSIPPNADDTSGTGAEESLVYALSGNEAPDAAWIFVVVGVVFAVAACGAIGVYRQRHTRKAEQ